ncbi:hypothetical protein BD410DRAFT_866666 [Rickenella mellea]|uniref:Uncharacterized protein n=1 Tax=Rickenella mellea TaxID=50990 RepID=A0A4Y7Q2K0_9AGAM|nr:hypothetical protein BD410DRAFT_866666 [Rickenella mellea]
MASTTCLIPSNPGIAGIGVRISIYIQAATALVPAALKIIEDQLYENTVPEAQRTQFYKTVVNWDNIKDVATPNILLGFAILVSSVIQAHVYGLTVYHGLILLNLHIIIGFSVSPYFILSANDNINPMNRLGQNPAHIRLAQLHVVHLSCAASFGLWLFVTINHFDHSDPDCTSSTFYYALGKNVSVNHSGFRDFWIVMYAFLVVPLVNLTFLLFMFFVISATSFVFLVLVSVVVGVILALTLIKEKYLVMSGRLTVLFLAALTPGALMLFLTEAMIKVNHVAAGESQWTFGQTIALSIAILPLWNVYKQTKEITKRIRAGLEPPATDAPEHNASDGTRDVEANGGKAQAVETTSAIQSV